MSGAPENPAPGPMCGRGVTFDDVAVYFSADEWETLETWQKELYKEVMVDHYQTLLSVGLMKVIPETILKIMMGEELAVNHKSAARVTALDTSSPDMSPARPQGNTNASQPLENPYNNTSGTRMNLRHKKLNLPPEIFPRSTRQKEEVAYKKSEVQENILEKVSKADVDMLPAIEKKTQEEKHYICVDCGKTFGQWSSLLKHTTTKSCVRPHSCSDCGASFNYRSQLLTHQKIHSGLKPFECPTCKKCFLRKSSLEVHVRTHTGERPFMCKLCNKSFLEHTKLLRHVRIHTGERSFRCDTCDKCFSDSSVLTRHKKVYCPSKKSKSKKTCPVAEHPKDCILNAEAQSDLSITCVEAGQVCLSVLKDKVLVSGLGKLQVVGDAKVPTIEKLYNTNGTLQEIKSNDPLDTSGDLVSELHPTAEHGGTKYWSVTPMSNMPVPNTPVPNTPNNICNTYFILIIPPAQTSNIHTLNTITTHEENTVKEMDNRVNSSCDYHHNTTTISVKNDNDESTLLNSVCGPYEGPVATHTNMVHYDGEGVSQDSQAKNQKMGNEKKRDTMSSQVPGADNKEKTSNQCGENIMDECCQLIPNKGHSEETVHCDCGFQHSLKLEEPQKSTISCKTYKCKKCESAFSDKGHLISHLSTHTKDRPYTCTECNVSFKAAAELQWHLGIHTREKPFCCAECGKKFKDQSVLNRHNKIHKEKVL